MTLLLRAAKRDEKILPLARRPARSPCGTAALGGVARAAEAERTRGEGQIPRIPPFASQRNGAPIQYREGQKGKAWRTRHFVITPESYRIPITKQLVFISSIYNPQSMKPVATHIRLLYRTFLSFEYEVNTTYRTIVVPLWSQAPWRNRLPHVLYGCVMWSFAWVDRLSTLRRGNNDDQSRRMADFLETYLRYDRAIASFAIKLWRHTLMHTAEPRALLEKSTGLQYRWLLHWGPELPHHQHMTVSSSGKTRILNMALLHLVADLKSGQRDFFDDIYRRSDLQQKLLKAEEKLSIVGNLKSY